MNTTTTANVPIDDYDYQGAATYIAVILIWYSIGLILMLFFHVRPRGLSDHFLFDDYETTNQLRPSKITNPYMNYDHILAGNTQKQILNELKDPERRQRLWKIYYASREKENEPDPQYYQTISADSITIGRINRKLATIHRVNKRDNSSDTPDAILSANESAKFFSKRLMPIRRSSGVSADNELSVVKPRSGSASALVSDPEAEWFINEIQAKTTTTNSSKKRNNKFLLPRFTVEKVSENNRNCQS